VVLVARNGDQRLDPGGLAGIDGRGAKVPGVGRELLGTVQALGQRLNLLKHWRYLLLVVGRLGDLGDQHQHGVGVGQRLRVVALIEPAAGDDHDA
jgi:hypothetical protein